MKKVLLTLCGAVLLTALLTDPAASQQDPCEGLQVVESETLLCTHGGDPLEAFEGSASIEQAAAPAPAAPCPDGGVSGKRVEVIYAVPSDRNNNYAASLPSVRAAVNDADSFLDQSSPDVVGQHYRWLCENGSDVTVRNVTLIPVDIDGKFSHDDMVRSLENQIALGLGPSDFKSDDRKYLVFVDQISDAYPFGGQGTIFKDDSPNPTTNRHQTVRGYSLINGFGFGSGALAEHELGHNIGAVQVSAPHSSRPPPPGGVGGWHCFDEFDRMCYPDGGTYFVRGGPLVFNCPGLPDTHFDCGQDDYYNVKPAAGTYLASHWNVSNSDFLTAPIFTCFGVPATIIGTTGKDTLVGTPGDDVIVGLGGNDAIDGKGGDDRLCGGEGDDTIRGGLGDDRIDGGLGNDSINGGPGNDTIFGGTGNDTIAGAAGGDQIDGGPDRDSINGGPGTDVCVNGEIVAGCP
jgi:hypothetical protein